MRQLAQKRTYKRSERVLLMLSFLLFAFIVCTDLAEAVITTELDPASRDILFNSRFEGDMSTIKPITNFVDIWIVRLVSFIGFLIIMTAMVKNALAGLVLNYPEFFLRAHAAATGELQNPGFGAFLASKFDVIPWVDVNVGVRPRDYFLKAIPLAVLSVFVGSFIFSAYYRDTIGNFSVLSLHVWDKFILSRDYIADFDKIVDSGTEYDFTFDKTEAGKRRAKLAKEIYSKIKQAYGNIQDTEAKAALGASVEKAVQEWTEINNFIDNEDYKFSFTVTNTNTSVTPLAQQDEVADNIKIYYKNWQMGQFISSDENANKASEYWIKTTVKFAPNVFAPGQTIAQNSITADITAPLSVDTTANEATILLPDTSTAFKFGSNTQGSVMSVNGKYEVVVTVVGSKSMKIKPKDKNQKLKIETGTYTFVGKGTALMYKQHKIESFTLKNGGSSTANISVHVNGNTYKYGDEIRYSDFNNKENKKSDNPL